MEPEKRGEPLGGILPLSISLKLTGRPAPASRKGPQVSNAAAPPRSRGAQRERNVRLELTIKLDNFYVRKPFKRERETLARTKRNETGDLS